RSDAEFPPPGCGPLFRYRHDECGRPNKATAFPTAQTKTREFPPAAVLESALDRELGKQPACPTVAILRSRPENIRGRRLSRSIARKPVACRRRPETHRSRANRSPHCRRNKTASRAIRCSAANRAAED